MIIDIEGTDASGKATQSKILAERIGARLFSFPDYNTPAGKAITGNLKSDWDVGVRLGKYRYPAGEPDAPFSKEHHEAKLLNALVLQSLMTTNRLERGAELRFAAKAGHVVLDRYDASARVYGTLDGLEDGWLREINTQLPVRPDLYILLDVPIEESFRRRPERRDRYEKDRQYLERVRVLYLRLFAEEQALRVQALRGASDFDVHSLSLRLPRWIVVDGVGAVEEVAQRIYTKVLT